MVVGSLALAGIPIFAGFFSKDEILGEAFGRGYYLFWAVGLLVAFMTAFYTFRMVYMTFHGSWRGPRDAWQHVHESAPTIVAPLIILAVPTILVGLLLGIPPEGGLIHGWLEEVFRGAEELGRRDPARLDRRRRPRGLRPLVGSAACSCCWAPASARPASGSPTAGTSSIRRRRRASWPASRSGSARGCTPPA